MQTSPHQPRKMSFANFNGSPSSIITDLFNATSITPIKDEPTSFQLNDPVLIERINGTKSSPSFLQGVVAHQGPVSFSENTDWIGIELTGSSIGCGKNDGCVKGERYFSCEMNDGLFVKRGNVWKSTSMSKTTQNGKESLKHTMTAKNNRSNTNSQSVAQTNGKYSHTIIRLRGTLSSTSMGKDKHTDTRTEELGKEKQEEDTKQTQHKLEISKQIQDAILAKEEAESALATASRKGQLQHTRIETLEENLNKLQYQYDTISSHNQLLTSTLINTQQNHVTLKNTLDTERQKQKPLQTELDTANCKLVTLQNDLSIATCRHYKDNIRCESQISMLQRSLEDLTTEKKKLELSLKEQVEEIQVVNKWRRYCHCKLHFS